MAKFNPKDNITRAEVVKILDNAIGGFYHNADTVTENASKIVIVNADGVILQDMTIQGDLLLAEGIDGGTVSLNNVKVTGRVIVRGGTDIIVKGDSTLANVELIKQDGSVTLKVEDNADVTKVTVQEGSEDATLTGAIESLSLIGSNVTVYAVDATINTAEISGKNSRLVVDEDSVVNQLTVTKTGTGATIEGDGNVKKATIEGNNVAIDTIGTKVTVQMG